MDRREFCTLVLSTGSALVPLGGAQLAPKTEPGGRPIDARFASEREMVEMREWVAAKLEGVQQAERREPGLVVLEAHVPVQQNAHDGGPLKIRGREYRRGIYCQTPTKILVRLPGAGKTFTAVAGLNSYKLGSDIFSVSAAGRKVLSVEVGRQIQPGVPISGDLGGTQEFMIEVSDPAYGEVGDEAYWADAKVLLADGREIWVGELPIEGKPEPYTTDPPFSFTYGGQSSRDLLSAWKVARTSRELDQQRTQHEIRYSDRATGLVLLCVAVEYHDFPTVEWTLYFRNNGPAPTPIVENIQALDTRFERNQQGEFVLHHNTGSPYGTSAYRPFETVLQPKWEKDIATSGGRPTDANLPCFNIAWPSQGVIAVIGWPGQWAAHFGRDDGSGLTIRAGQELTHFSLEPGEEVRSPLVVLQFWKGDWLRGQNIWRRWMIEYNAPRPGGSPPVPGMAGSLWFQFYGAENEQGKELPATANDEMLFLTRYLENRIKLDYWWIDAGWYVNGGSSWYRTGTWEVDTFRYPGGLRPIFDHAHAKGLKSVLWFEPERVTQGTWLYEKRPEWLLGPEKGNKLLNLGNSEAWQWLVNHIDKLITEQGVDVYRNDFNMDPLQYWRANDQEDRQGITEIRYVTAFLAFWDELRRRHPKLLIDTCASGARRSDIETLRRSVIFWRNDYFLDPASQQSQTYGMAFWFTFFGNGVQATDPYAFFSVAACPMICCTWDMREGLNFALLRRLTDQRREIIPYYQGDYYPLTPYSLATDAWIAWQFNSPEAGEGMVQAFRRQDSPFESGRFKLRGLDPEAQYKVRNLDGGNEADETGRALMEKGVSVLIEDKPGATVLIYKQRQR